MLASDTQIYKDTYTLANVLFGITQKFTKDVKSTLARRIENCVLDLADSIVEANIDINHRSEVLKIDFIINYERLQFVLNLAVARKQITLRQQAHIARLMSSIGKQATRWGQSAPKRKGPNGVS